MKTKIPRGSWIVTVPVAAVAVVYVVLFFLPGKRAIGELREKIQQHQECIDQATAVAAMLPAVQKELQKAEDYNTAWEKQAPAVGEAAALHGKINALALAVGAELTRLEPTPVVPYDKIQQIPLTVSCTGSFAQISGFLRSLEELPQTLWIDSLSLEKPEEAGEAVECELSLVVFADNPENSD